MKHNRSLFRRVLTLLSVPCLALFSGLASAHPHVWADISVKVEFDDQGRVEALRQHWRLDPFYSLMLAEELKNAPGDASMDERLDQLGVEINRNLAPQGYLTHVRLEGKTLDIGEVTEYTTRTSGDRVEFLFRLPLAEPVVLEDDDILRYQVYDPSYYIEMVHEINDDQTPRDDALVTPGRNCTTRIVRADPDPAMVAKAAQLDRTDEAPEGLGRFFAETGEVQCP